MSLWSHSTGERGHTVRVFERKPGGPLWAVAWDAKAGKKVRVSLGHRDKARAKKYATRQAAKLLEGESDLAQGKVTLAQVFAQYLQHRTPRKKGEKERKTDARRAEMWTRILGAGKDPHTISLGEWEAFIDARSSGAIDARGKPAKKPRPVRARAVEEDCNFLRWVFNWAAKWRLENGRYLMRENPVRGYEAPYEKNPRRPVATADRFEAIRAVTDSVPMEIRWGGKVREQRSYLSEILDIVNGTGRRISAVCSLRYSDLRLERSPQAPHGAILWPADTDKEGYEALVPISPTVRAALDRVLRDRPGIGAGPLFPSPMDPEKPITKHLADKWLRKAEKLAGVAPQRGSLWHAYRRKWATERKHLPDVDVAQAGGWRSLIALKQSYQHADAETMLSVVLGGGELREAK